MTYDAYETGRATGSPFETYLFTYGLGPNDYYGYNDTERDLVIAGKNYLAHPIERDAITTSGGRNERRDIKVTMSAKEELLNLFQIYPPDQPISVIIRQSHQEDGDDEFVTAFTGIVINVKTREDGVAEVLCRPLWAAAQQGGLRRHYQIGCPHVLYGGACGAAELKTTTTYVANTGLNKVQLASGWEGAYDPSKFRAGFLRWVVGSNTHRRTILSISSNVLTLSGPCLDLSFGHSMDVVLGCNHQMDDCKDLHSNLANYGGQPWIPTKNPINTNPYWD